MKPLKSLLRENNFNEVLKRYDKHLIESIEYIEMIPDYFGKHSVIFYSMDSRNQINLKRDSNYQLIDRYGGELIENCIDEEILKQCSKAGTPVVISFKLHSYELKKLDEIYLYMIYKIIGKEYQFMDESYINKDIPPCDIIEVKEIDKL